MSQSGFQYYYNLLGFDLDSYRVHFAFQETGGQTINNSAPNFPQISGSLSSTSGFFTNPGSGHFSGQSISLNSASGIPSDFWTHIFIIDRNIGKKGIIFDSFQTGTVYSGFSIGLNDNNKLCFESYDQNGPYSKTSSIILGKKNLVAVSKSSNLLSFYAYDFNNQEVLSDSFNIQGSYVFPSNKAVIGNTGAAFPPFAESSFYSGFIDEYVIVQEAISSAALKFLFSGLVSDYFSGAPVSSGFQTIEITGYGTGITGVTGITGFQNIITGSGLDPFSTGDYQFFYATTGLTGYLSSGIAIIPLTGLVTHFITGDFTETITPNSGQIASFYLDEISLTRKIKSNDILVANVYSGGAGNWNLTAPYDYVQGRFQLQDFYNDSQVQIYRNGASQFNLGSTTTGNFYNNGVSISGDYTLLDNSIETTGAWGASDTIVYDLMSGQKNYIPISQALDYLLDSSGGIILDYLGNPILVPDFFNSIVYPTGTKNYLTFLNGNLITSGVDFYYSGSQFIWKNIPNNISGIITQFPINFPYSQFAGQGFLPTIALLRKNSQLFLNGARQKINSDYIENCVIDLIHQSGIFQDDLSVIFGDETNFFTNSPTPQGTIVDSFGFFILDSNNNYILQ